MGSEYGTRPRAEWLGVPRVMFVHDKGDGELLLLRSRLGSLT